MSRISIAGLAAICVLLLAFAYGAGPPAPHAIDAPDANQPFSGEMVVLYSFANKRGTVALRSPTIRTINGRAFLVGAVVNPSGRDWRADATVVWHPIDDVGQLVEFAQVDSYLKMRDRYDQAPEM